MVFLSVSHLELPISCTWMGIIMYSKWLLSAAYLRWTWCIGLLCYPTQNLSNWSQYQFQWAYASGITELCQVTWICLILGIVSLFQDNSPVTTTHSQLNFAIDEWWPIMRQSGFTKTIGSKIATGLNILLTLKKTILWFSDVIFRSIGRCFHFAKYTSIYKTRPELYCEHPTLIAEYGIIAHIFITYHTRYDFKMQHIQLKLVCLWHIPVQST